MDSLNSAQITLLLVECIFVVIGLLVWIKRQRIQPRGLVWDVPLTDTMMLVWALLLGAALGQMLGFAVLKSLPAAIAKLEYVQVIAIGSALDGGCIVAWLAVHVFLATKGTPLPPAIEVPLGALRAFREGAITFVQALPVILVVGLLWGLLLRALNLPTAQQDIVGVFARTESPFAIAGMLLIAAVAAPVAEELLFRAGIFRMIKERAGRLPAMAISSALFALLHLSWLSFAPLFCLGIVFCLAYERSRNIGVSMVAHGLFNLNSILLIVLLPPDFLQ